jgi:hypothetical protein
MSKRINRYSALAFLEADYNLPTKASVELKNRSVLFGSITNINTDICVLETKKGKFITLPTVEIQEIHTDKQTLW